MPSIFRAIFVAIQVAAITALVGLPLSSISALGSPLPMPLPIKRAYADFTQRSEIGPRVMDGGHRHVNSTSPGQVKHVAVDYDTTSSGVHKRDDDTSLLDNLNMLNSYYTQMQQSAATINNLAGQTSSAGGTADYNQQYASALSTFHGNFLGFQTTLSDVSEDKGLANYDKADSLETMMKDTVNMVKYMLNDTDQAVAAIPGLGPPLADILYQVKCLVDLVMDATENMTDGMINDIMPLLQQLDILAVKTTCDAGIELAGFCIL